MLTKYIEQIYQCGENYIDMVVYPVYAQHKGKRRTRFRKTSDVQQKLNDRHREQHLTRLCNTNFTDNDSKIELTYSSDHLPENEEQANREMTNFLNRLKRYRKRKGLPELKYIWATEKRGKKKPRLHHHIIMSGGLTDTEIRRVWGRGFANSSSLIFSETGIEELAKYMLKYARSSADEKQGSGNYCGYHCSRNLKKPIKKPPKYSKLTRRKIEFMKKYNDDTNLENIFPGYRLVKIKDGKERIYHNDKNGGFYFECQYYKIPQNKKQTYKKVNKKRQN